MSDNDRDIDILLRRNRERQLAGFDWEGFHQGIDCGLTSAGAGSRSWKLSGRWAALAATVAVTAGVLVLTLICATQPGRVASIPGMAQVTIIEATHVIGTAQVSFLPEARPARGEVQILTSDKQLPPELGRASWCIIARSGPAEEERRREVDTAETLCLF